MVHFGPAFRTYALYSKRESNSDTPVIPPKYGVSACRCWGIRGSGREAKKTDPVRFRGESEKDRGDFRADGSVSDPGVSVFEGVGLDGREAQIPLITGRDACLGGRPLPCGHGPLRTSSLLKLGGGSVTHAGNFSENCHFGKVLIILDILNRNGESLLGYTRYAKVRYKLSLEIIEFFAHFSEKSSQNYTTSRQCNRC